jgi:hypothetical protein
MAFSQNDATRKAVRLIFQHEIETSPDLARSLVEINNPRCADGHTLRRDPIPSQLLERTLLGVSSVCAHRGELAVSLVVLSPAGEGSHPVLVICLVVRTSPNLAATPSCDEQWGVDGPRLVSGDQRRIGSHFHPGNPELGQRRHLLFVHTVSREDLDGEHGDTVSGEHDVGGPCKQSASVAASVGDATLEVDRIPPQSCQMFACLRAGRRAVLELGRCRIERKKVAAPNGARLRREQGELPQLCAHQLVRQEALHADVQRAFGLRGRACVIARAMSGMVRLDTPELEDDRLTTLRAHRWRA